MNAERICFFSGDITRGGGTERISILLANALCRRERWDICFLSLAQQSPRPFFELDERIPRYVLTKEKELPKPGPAYLPLPGKLRRFLKEHRIDVLIDIDLVLDLLSVPASRGLPLRLISWQHFNVMFERGVWYRRLAMRLTAKRADCVVTLTRPAADYLKNTLKRRRETAVIGSPMPPMCEEPPRRENMILTVGYLTYGKGADMLAEMAPQVLLAHPDWKWVLLGEGPEREALERAARENGLEDRLLLMGRTKDVFSWLARGRIFALLSRSEGFIPLCMLEARSCRLPSVCFDVFPGSDIVEDSVTGYLIPPFQTELFRQRLEELMESPATRQRMADSCAQGIDRFSEETFIARWERVLEGAPEAE